jgi:integrase/recombinase XerD
LTFWHYLGQKVTSNMAKNNGCGQAAVLTPKQLARLRKALENPQHRLFFDIARLTGERWGAIRLLQVSDVYREPARSVPHEHITFPGRIRKSCGGTRSTRQVPVSSALGQLLRAHKPPATGWLFPGGVPGLPISRQRMDAVLRAAATAAGLVGVGTHSTRRTAATRLHEQGVSPRDIQAFMGWANLNQVTRYCEVSEEQKLAVAELL